MRRQSSGWFSTMSPRPTNFPEYFSSLQRVQLTDINARLRQSFLSPEQVETYKKTGILIVEEVFNSKDISAAVQACERLEDIARDAQQSYADINLEAAGGGWDGQDGEKASYSGQIRKVENIIDHDESLRQMIFQPHLLHIISSLLGSDFQLHSKGFLMNKPPGVSSEKPWHQDGAYFPGGTEVVTVWIPLQDVNEDNGCLYALPSSHKLGALHHVSAEAQVEISSLDLDKVRPYPMKSGSVFLMDKYTLHYSGINQTTAQRRALLFRYEGPLRPRDQLREYLDSAKTQCCGIVESYSQVFRRIGRELEGLDRPDVAMLDILCHEAEQVSQVVKKLAQGSLCELGGGISIELRRAEEESTIEKSHLIMNRVLQGSANGDGVEFLDMGTDYFYPFYTDYEPTQEALKAFRKHTDDAMHYPSSYGLQSLRQTFKGFMQSQFGVILDEDKEIMVNTGASQAFDALSRAFRGRYVLLPPLSLPTVSVIARGNGAELIRLPLHEGTGLIDLLKAQGIINRLSEPGCVRFMYFNSPANPSGHVASLSYLQQLVEFAKTNNILVVHDMDSWYTHHSETGRLHNILEVHGARDCCISLLSLSKEFGLSGIRVGLIAGNSTVINAIRIHNSTFAVMIPEICQRAAEAALEAFGRGDQKTNINTYVTKVMRKTICGWQRLGWPDTGVHPPIGGFKYLVSVPPNIKPQGGFSPVELFDFYVASRAFVKFSTSKSFDPKDGRFIRIVLMQKEEQIEEVFRRLESIGVRYEMELPQGLHVEYESFLSKHACNDF